MPPPTSTTFFLAFLAVSLPRREASAFQSRAASKLGAAAFAYDVGIERERAARNINRDIGVIITHSLARSRSRIFDADFDLRFVTGTDEG